MNDRRRGVVVASRGGRRAVRLGHASIHEAHRALDRHRAITGRVGATRERATGLSRRPRLSVGESLRRRPAALRRRSRGPVVGRALRVRLCTVEPPRRADTDAVTSARRDATDDHPRRADGARRAPRAPAQRSRCGRAVLRVLGSGRIGQIVRGVYDPAARTVAITYFQSWNNMTGSARFDVRPDGRELRGRYAQPNGSGPWVLIR